MKEHTENIKDAQKWGETFEEYRPVYNNNGNFIYSTGDSPDQNYVYIF